MNGLITKSFENIMRMLSHICFGGWRKKAGTLTQMVGTLYDPTTHGNFLV